MRNQTSGNIRRTHAAIRERLPLGESDAVISATLGVPRHTVQRVRLKAGIQRQRLVLPPKGSEAWQTLAAAVSAGIDAKRTDEAIGLELGLAASAIRRVREHEGWRQRKSSARKNRGQIKQTTIDIAAALNAGESVVAVAVRFGMSRENIYYIRRSHCPELCARVAEPAAEVADGDAL